jgi:hypothetical protein
MAHKGALFANAVAETSVGEDYWEHMQNKVSQLERMWLDRMRPRNYRVDKAEPIGSGPPKLWA